MTAVDTTRAESVAGELFGTEHGRTDPYPRYHELRALAPVFRSESVGAWLLTRYDDCHAVLRDPRFVRGYERAMDARFPAWRERPAFQRGQRSMLNLDGPAHTRLRKLVSKSFTPRTVERLRPRIEGMVDELLDPYEKQGGGDLMQALAFPLPVWVIGELLGVPREDTAPFRERVRRITAVFEIKASSQMLDEADEATVESEAYFAELIETKRRDPGEDLVSDLLGAEEGEDRLTDVELNTLASLLFGAGFETTTNLIGNGVMALLDHPDELARLRDHPELISNLPDELLRYDGTVQVTARVANEVVDVDGNVISPGDSVLPIVGAGNRDPARYKEPDRFDLTRADIRPLTFGGGVHFCIGAALARLETEIVFRKLVDRLGTIELAGDAVYRDRLTLRGPGVLPLAVGEQRSQKARMTETSVTTLPLRPRGPGDGAWRAAFREQVEGGAGPDPAELRARVELLLRVPLFRGCTVDEVQSLAATAFPISFETGDMLCIEGGESPECYVIAEGEATVTIAGDDVRTVGADDVVGERGPLEGRARTATVTAASHLIAYAISRERLVQLLADSPSAADAMRQELERRYDD